MSIKEILIKKHRKKLVELTYLALLGRSAEDSAMGPAVDAISEKGFDCYINCVRSSEEFCLKYGGTSLLETPVDLSGLTPKARRIYADLKQAMKSKKGAITV